MRRRLVAAIVATVLVALVLAGLGTLVLSELGARRYTERELREQVTVIVESLSRENVLPQNERPRLLAAIREALRLEGVGLLALDADGAVRGDLPDGVVLTDEELDALRRGDTISGVSGRLVYAGDTIDRGGALTAVILSDRAGIALSGTAPWFALAALVVLLLAAGVAVRLAGGLTRPLRHASEASRRIAEGDLAARVPEPPTGAHDEVADLSRSVNSMAGALQRSRSLEQQFLLSVSHDLRTPLSSIRGYAEALADGTAPDAAHAGAVIQAEAGRLERLVRDLLELARLDARSFSLDPLDVDLDELVAACVDGFAPEAQAAGLTVTVGASPVQAHVDPDRMAQVVANLLENAFKHARGRVQVQVERDGSTARVSVEDDGPGIAADDLPHVFDRLYVSRRPPERAESGSGLGLAIVRELVAAMGGEVGAGAGSLGGARFWVALPAR